MTPLARDLLKRQGITIRLGGTAGSESRAAGANGPLPIEAESGTVQALRRAFARGSASPGSSSSRRSKQVCGLAGRRERDGEPCGSRLRSH